MGAGVIPFTMGDRDVNFLFQRTFSGRKAGYLIDFGGGVGAGEDGRRTAVREFVEETETMYFCDDLQRAQRSENRIREQLPLVEALFERTLATHPDWCCRRAPGNPRKPRQWVTYFIEFPYRDIHRLNREWRDDNSGRFRKRRELVWVSGNALLSIYADMPERLWKRVRQLQGAETVIRAIQDSKRRATR